MPDCECGQCCGSPCNSRKLIVLIQHPKATLANRIIHGIRGEIGAVRPLNRAQHNSGLTKGCRVPQRLEDGAVDRWIAKKQAHVHFTRSSHPQKSRGAESLVKQQRMLHARERYAVSPVLLQGFYYFQGFQLAA